MKNAETNDFERKIRADYLVGRSETDADAEALGKLIKKINRPAKIFGYVFGIAGLLLFGAGMCVTLTAAADFFCGRRDREPYRRFDDGPRPSSLRHGAYRPQKQIFGQSSRSQRTSARKQSLNDCRASGSKYIKYFRRYEL